MGASSAWVDPKAQSPEPHEGVHGFVTRSQTYQRPAILILLRERESHGYELVQRLGGLGFEVPVTASIYAVLRAMEADGLVTSSWDTSRRGGPPRRVYAATVEGEAFLGEAVPVLNRHRNALGAMLDSYRASTGPVDEASSNASH